MSEQEQRRGPERSRAGLVLTIVLAVAALLGVSTALLVFDPRATGADALRTGGLAAGSIVALYALWLNDRRRRVEEQRQRVERDRQELENRRTDLDRDRVADERFARAIELLGHDTDQVRVGALHALAGLARSHPDHTQTVLDVLCSYLRRPFAHPRYADDEPRPRTSRGVPVGHAPRDARTDPWTDEAINEAERMLQVRLTAQRLILDLLPHAEDTEAPAHDLDLTNATLEYFELVDRKVGTVMLRYAHLFSSSDFSRCAFHGPVWFTGTRVGSGRRSGKFRCEDAVFHQRAWFCGITFGGRTSFARTRFTGPAKFADTTFTDSVSMVEATFADTADFRSVHFGHDVDLSGVEFHGTTWHSDIGTAPGRRTALPEGW